MRPALRQARPLLTRDALAASIPLFLCPAHTPHRQAPPLAPSKTFSSASRARQQPVPSTEAIDSPPLDTPPTSTPCTQKRGLPRACPGCGAPTQLLDKAEAGYYSLDRKATREYLGRPASKAPERREDEIYAHVVNNIDPALRGALGIAGHNPDASTEVEEPPETPPTPPTPVCDRCHNLIHHRVGTPIHHPTVEAIQQTIAESPHRRNHIYHVVDAADFPLSIVPRLQSSLRIPKLRTQNRRAKHKGWVAHDRIAEISFIVTRADLLAPKKEQVDALMPYIKDVLRDALGRNNKNARLGNVRLVSAKRGWWTKQVKEDIWERGGAGWMVGKVNVGKSNLFEAVFPKGRGADYQEVRKLRSATEREEMLNSAKSLQDLSRVQRELAEEDAQAERRAQQTQEHMHQPPEEVDPEEDFDDPDALLPAAQPYTLYPALPVASSIPGTTASPIRIPFGRNRGELIDLPGLARTTPGLETFVQPTFQSDLVMTNRMNAIRHALKPGQSLILGGGLIRLTPLTEDHVFILHPFVPMHAHATRTEKARDYQCQTSDRQLQVPPILAPNVGSKMNSAGVFQLKWDVTKALAGPVTSSVAGKMKPENLPFRIWSTDILIEGVGWVEVSCQTRRPAGWKPVGMVKKDPNHLRKLKIAEQQKEKERKDRKFSRLVEGKNEAVAHVDADAEGMHDVPGDEMPDWEDAYPEIQVFSPLGKFVGARRPMCASTVSGPKHVPSRDRKVRPPRSMVSVKRQRKPMKASS
ncbi:hypothetical protein BDU57DRAFT_517700 [Ampelomyces quisqualis]|uniref:Genetic interactor of prohibitins 3, mitochondrial n=1 Tax=Ampelomyces quisqualis TaxID=50730 RepID=A0A6A5QR90_AMPQU|nr:hypothetical protein BDU57DRAFT_517700 [Ampelomyces quisqualis]